ncbi:MAG: GGDEF domain-containing protein, partial [Peptococcaceae bacterium]|nr:GGDEF domain-containing protein [Peptococcaceae bacterium]
QKKILGVFSRLPKEYGAQFEERRLETNVGRMYIFSIYVVLLQIALNLINILKQSGGPPDGELAAAGGVDIGYYVALSLGTLALGLIYWFLFRLVKKNKITRRRVKIFLVESLLYLYTAAQLTFCAMNILSGGGVNSYIIAILIIGLVPVTRPLQSLLSIGLAFVYTGAALYMSRGVSSAWDAILLTDNWTNLLIITGLTVCVSIFIYDMYVSNFLQSVDLRKSNQELEVMANTDQMTGVANRYSFSRTFDAIWQSSLSRQSLLAVAIADIDFFKAYNDRFGHLEGDKCLRQVAGSLQASFRRASDIVSRFGGEEFLMVFEASQENAFTLADRARIGVEALRIPHGRTDVSPHVTISIGVCLVRPEAGITSTAALAAADEALYESKQTGRNKTTLRELKL